MSHTIENTGSISTDPEVLGRRLVEHFAGSPSDGQKHYREACAWYGALQVAGLLGDEELLHRLVRRFDPYPGTFSGLLGETGHVDRNVFGIVPLEIYLQTGNGRYADEGLAIADHQYQHIGNQIRFAIDDMFMITSLQVQAYRVTGDGRYLDLAATTMGRYLEKLQQEDGLFFHHPDFRHKWCRGNGWVAAGMAHLIRELPESHPAYSDILTAFRKMMDSLVRYQTDTGDGSGLWKQIVDSDDPRNWPETSGSAMFCYALHSGVCTGTIPAETCHLPARRAWEALLARTDANGQLRDISKWAYRPSSHPESGDRYDNDEENYYFERQRLCGENHGQAPMLWTTTELIRRTQREH